MYKLVEIYARPRRVTGRWERAKVDGDATLLDLPGRWGDVVLIVSFNNGQDERSIRFDNLRKMVEFSKVKATTTINDYLGSVGNKTLPFDDVRFTLKPRYAYYKNLTHLGYRVDPIGRHDNPDQAGDKRGSDLLIHTGYKNGKHIGQYGLFSINGLFHLSDYDASGVYLHDGNRTQRRSNDCQVGVVSFERLGKVKHIPITNEMIKSGGSDVSLEDTMYLKLPDGLPTTGWSYLFIVGGYIVPIGEGIVQIDERLYRVNIKRLNLMDRYFDTYGKIDYSALNLTKYPDYSNETYTSTNEFFSDDVLRAFFTLPQSFIVAVETPQLFHNVVPIETPYTNAGVTDTVIFDEQPILGVNGCQIEYHPVYREGVVTLYTEHNIGRNYNYLHRPWRKQNVVDNKLDVEVPYYKGQMHLRLMGTDF